VLCCGHISCPGSFIGMAALLPLVAIVGERHHLQCLLCGVRGHLLALILLPIRSFHPWLSALCHIKAWRRDAQASLCCVRNFASLVTERDHLGIAYLVMHSGNCGQGACSPAGHPPDRGGSPALRASSWCLPPRCSGRLLHGRGIPTHVYPPFCKENIYRYPGSDLTALTLCCIQPLACCNRV